MPERVVNPGETVVQHLHAASQLLIVRVTNPPDGPVYECRGCVLLAFDCTRSGRFHGAAATLDHLDDHAKQGDSGTKDAIWKLEACVPCRGIGTQHPAGWAAIEAQKCGACDGTGKNKFGRDREVRRGVVVS